MRYKAVILLTGLIFTSGVIYARNDTIVESFNGICDQTTSPGRTYAIDYTGSDGVEWRLKTLYSSSSWWGGIDDEGNPVTGLVHCGSLQWDENNSGYAKATISKGISSLSFQMRYGYQLVGGYVRVLVNDIEIGRTDTLDDKDLHTFTFDINTGGPLNLELIPVVESSVPGGIIVDNLSIISSDLSIPFSHVELLDDYVPWMDTLKPVNDTIELYVYAEQCLEINGAFVDWFDMTDDVELTVGSVIDLNPGDSCSLYYWGSVLPGIGSTGGDVSVSLQLPVNAGSDSIGFETSDGEDIQEGTFSFMNGNVDYDLVVFKLSDRKHDYRIRYTYESFAVSDSAITTYIENEMDHPVGDPAVRFYPNPVQNHAWFETSKTLRHYEIYNLEGRKLYLEQNPELSGEGYYRLDLGLLDAGIWIVRFTYEDGSTDTVKILVE